MPAGDRVLQMFARVVTRTLGAEVLFGRIGGEEFDSFLPVGDIGEAVAIADRVRRNFAEAAARFSEGELLPTVSVGDTLSSDGKTVGDDLLVAAEEAIYRATAEGRNRVEAGALAGEEASRTVAAPSIVPILGAARLGIAA